MSAREQLHPVLREIKLRQEGGRTEGSKLALAIEGGGMRAVISSGMCAALESYGIGPECFDVVYGSSAGSVIAAFYLANQIRFGTPVFYEEITTRAFIDYRRAFKRLPIMNLDFLIRHVIVERKPLNFDKVLASGKLRVIVTDVDKGARALLGPPQSTEQLQDYLQASESIPMIARAPYVVDGRPYIDASISEAIPWQAAIDDGATHVLALSSRPLGHSKKASLSNSIMEWLWTRRYGPHIKELAKARFTTSAERAFKLQEMTLSPREDGPYVLAIYPDPSHPQQSRLSQSASELVLSCEAGFNATAQAFGFQANDDFRTKGTFDRASASTTAD